MSILDLIANPQVPSYLDNIKVMETVKDRQAARQAQEVQSGIALQKLQMQKEQAAQQQKAYETIQSRLNPTAPTQTALQAAGQPSKQTTPALQATGQQPIPEYIKAPAEQAQPQAQPQNNIQQNPVVKTLSQVPTNYIKEARNLIDLTNEIAGMPGVPKETQTMLVNLRKDAEDRARTQTQDEINRENEMNATIGNMLYGASQLEDSGNIPAAEAEYNNVVNFIANDPRFNSTESVQQFLQAHSTYQPGLAKLMYFATEVGAKARDQLQKEKQPETYKAGQNVNDISMALNGKPYQSASLEERQQVLEYMQKAKEKVSAVQGTGLGAKQEERTDLLIQKTQEIINTASDWNTGLMSAFANLPEFGLGARNLKAVIDTVKANIAWSELSDMRRESKTGGALGQVTERELDLLAASIGSLDQAQDKEQLVKVATEIQKHYKAAKAMYEVTRNVHKAAIGQEITLPDGRKIKITKHNPNGDDEFDWVQ
jgi:hypothetical protein